MRGQAKDMAVLLLTAALVTDIGSGVAVGEGCLGVDAQESTRAGGAGKYHHNRISESGLWVHHSCRREAVAIQHHFRHGGPDSVSLQSVPRGQWKTPLPISPPAWQR